MANHRTNIIMRIVAVITLVLVAVFSFTVGGTLERGELIPASEDGATKVFLVLGTDNREENQHGRADAIMLVAIDPEENRIALVSVQRDLLVTIPGYEEQNRINAAYRHGGADLMRQTIWENLGVQIDGTIEVDFAGFKDIIHALGGVRMDLSETEASYLRGDKDGGNFVNGKAGRYTNGRTYPDAKEGDCLLDSEEALDFARARHVDNTNDFGRGNRQKRLIQALLEKLKHSSPKELLGTLNAGRKLLKEGRVKSSCNWEQLAGAGIQTLDIYRRKKAEEEEAAKKDKKIPEWLFQESYPQKGSYLDITYKKMAVIAPKDPQKAIDDIHRTLYGER